MRRFIQILLSLVPFLGITLSAVYFNTTKSTIFGIPPLYFWIATWVLVASPIMMVVKIIDRHIGRK